MKALEKHCVLGISSAFDDEMNFRGHRERIRGVKPSIDTSIPESVVISSRNAANSPRKSDFQTMMRKKITRDNLFLARRIFDIMEGPGMISDIVNKDTRHLDLHPGTLNFRKRLKDARKIHAENMAMATRLDKMKPFSVPPIVKTTPKKASPGKKKKPLFLKSIAPRVQKADAGSLTQRSLESEPSEYSGSKSARKASPEKSRRSQKPQNVLLEYTKIQDGRVLDVAVIKEPFRDKYAIFGIDIDNGQRYELRLTSEDVSNILDGDILVTSVDNVEVWMALLNKVNLRPVEAFAKLPSVPNTSDIVMDVSQQSADDWTRVPRVPSEPLAPRPQSRPSSRPQRVSSKGPPSRPGASASPSVSMELTDDDLMEFAKPRKPAAGGSVPAPASHNRSLTESMAKNSVDDIMAKAYVSYSSLIDPPTSVDGLKEKSVDKASVAGDEDVWEDVDDGSSLGKPNSQQGIEVQKARQESMKAQAVKPPPGPIGRKASAAAGATSSKAQSLRPWGMSQKGPGPGPPSSASQTPSAPSSRRSSAATGGAGDADTPPSASPRKARASIVASSKGSAPSSGGGSGVSPTPPSGKPNSTSKSGRRPIASSKGSGGGVNTDAQGVNAVDTSNSSSQGFKPTTPALAPVPPASLPLSTEATSSQGSMTKALAVAMVTSTLKEAASRSSLSMSSLLHDNEPSKPLGSVTRIAGDSEMYTSDYVRIVAQACVDAAIIGMAGVNAPKISSSGEVVDSARSRSPPQRAVENVRALSGRTAKVTLQTAENVVADFVASGRLNASNSLSSL